MTHQEFKERLEGIQLQYRAELRQGLNELAGHDPLDQATQSLITLFEDYTKSIVEPVLMKDGSPVNHTAEHLRQTINQNSKTILRGRE